MDGAPAMLGLKPGFASRLKEMAPGGTATHLHDSLLGTCIQNPS